MKKLFNVLVFTLLYFSTVNITHAIQLVPAAGSGLVLEDFNNGSLNNWEVNDVIDSRKGPSSWAVTSGELKQSSKIWSRPSRSNPVDKLGSYLLYLPGISEANYKAHTTLRSKGSGHIGLMFRVKDENNYYRFSWDRQKKKRILIKNVNGKFTLLAQDKKIMESGRAYQLDITSMGNSIEVKVDGAVVFSVKDTDISSGSIALYSWRNNGAFFDDVVVERIASFNNSPVITSLTAEPANIRVTDTSQLNVIASDSDGPQTISYLWSVLSGGGSFDDPASASPIYTPSSVTESFSTVSLQVQVSDGTNSVNEKIDLVVLKDQVLSDDFSDRDYNGWRIVDAKNTRKGPSKWSAKSGSMMQLSSIYTGNRRGKELPKPGTYALYEPGAGLVDYSVSLDIRSTSRDAIGLMFRVKDSNNYYRFSWNKRLNKRQLVKNVDGVFSLLAEDSIQYIRRKIYKLDIRVQGSLIEVYIDGEQVFSVNDKAIPYGTIALYSWGNSGSYFDNVAIDELRDVNLPPVLSGVAIRDVNGNQSEGGDVFSLSYQYFDEEGDAEGVPVIQWQRDSVAIPGATSPAYTSSDADVGRSLNAKITPVALTGVTTGLPVESNSFIILSSDRPPVVTPPADVLTEATGMLTPVTLGAATAIDDRDGALVPQADTLGPFGIGTNDVTWRVTDSGGNVGSAIQKVTIIDTVPPVLTAPSDVTIKANSQPPVSLNIGTATAVDIFNVAITNDAPVTFNTGSTTVTWTATDSNGNSSSATQVVTVTFDGVSTVNEADHLLRRITFGSSPSVLAEINSIGTKAYIDQQLAPLALDDSEFQTRIAGLPVNTRNELRSWSLLHMVYSKRQLLEVMTWFWDNHFNTDIRKIRGTDALLNSQVPFELQENQAFRQNALGNFRQLLEVSSKSPTMLIYLNSVDNVKDDANENYARELLELHTMGVDGGYGHFDIEAGAEIFTGWHLLNGAFNFNAAQHNFAAQQFLGQTIPSSGVAQGDQLLDILAAHSSTAGFICKKLVTLFVSDVPPQSLIDLCATRFQSTVNAPDQITQVLRVILNSTEFNDPTYNQAKVKTPVEFAVSIARALEGETTGAFMQNHIRRMGLTLYENSRPTGWSETGDDWISSGLMLERIKTIEYMMRVNRIESLMTDLPALFTRYSVSTSDEIIRFLLRQTLGESYPDQAYQQALSYLNGTNGFNLSDSDADIRLRRVIEIILSYPQFQFQ